MKTPGRRKRGPSDRSGPMFMKLPMTLLRHLAGFVQSPRALAAFGLACHGFLGGVKALPDWHGNLLDSKGLLDGVRLLPHAKRPQSS